MSEDLSVNSPFEFPFLFYRMKLCGFDSRHFLSNSGAKNLDLSDIDFGNFQNLILREDYPLLEQHLIDARDQKQSCVCYRIHFEDRIVWIEDFLKVEKRGEFDFVGYIKKISDKNIQLITKETLEHLKNIEKEKQQFIYLVSHDFQAPLRTVNSYAQFLKEDIEDSLNDESKLHLNQLICAGSRMQKMLNGLLELSRVKINVENILEFQVATTIKDVKLILESEFKDKKFEIIEQNLPAEIIIDPFHIQTIFYNILKNCIQNSADEQVKIEIDCDSDSNFHSFEIKDNGNGFDEKFAPRIFEPFYSYDFLEKKKTDRLGLGLTISKKIIEIYGGGIEAFSAINLGTVISFSVPKIIENPTKTP